MFEWIEDVQVILVFQRMCYFLLFFNKITVKFTEFLPMFPKCFWLVAAYLLWNLKPHLWLYLCNQLLHISARAPCCLTHPTMIIAIVSADTCFHKQGLCLQPHQAENFLVSWSFCKDRKIHTHPCNELYLDDGCIVYADKKPQNTSNN